MTSSGLSDIVSAGSDESEAQFAKQIHVYCDASQRGTAESVLEDHPPVASSWA
jgi:hypothetical protein